MRGIGKLHEAGISYTAICVVTPETIRFADTLIRFFTDLGCTSVGFNLEEQEGLNAHRPAIAVEDAERFWRRLWELRESGSQLAVRDLDRFCDWISARRTGDLTFGAQPIDPIPTVAFNGDVVVLSPELLGIENRTHRNFKVGNVLHDNLPTILNAATQASCVREFRAGLAKCAATCEFFDFCRGAQAGNRYFETGSFAVAETAYCRNTRQALVRAAAAHLDREEVN